MALPKMFRNPILPGFYPDPSVCRVGDDYYLVTSTFEYFPGLPVFHSRDLVHWHQIGHVLDRPSQLPLDGIRFSRGLYAPTIRYSNGTFYVINTLVDGKIKSGNFIVTATDPAGPWSEPYWLEGAPGIDPSLFFDEDGRAWYVGNRVPARNQSGPQKDISLQEREIWLQELDLQSMSLVGEVYVLWDGALKQAAHAEAPHIYKVEGRYYLMISEGGTYHQHAVTIARSDVITGPYEGNRGNPILTHRHLGWDYPIVGTGHADLVQTQHGEWWMFMLATRPYGGYFYNLGRETFMAPVRWEDGWPIVSPGTGKVEFSYPVPNLPETTWPQTPARDDFDSPALALHWIFLRTPRDEFYRLSERPGHLRLRLRPQQLSEPANPSFVGRRQQHIHFKAECAVEFTPQNEHECAGLVLIQNNDFHFRFVITKAAQPVLRLIKRAYGKEETLAEQPVRAAKLYLKVEAHQQAYSFYVADKPKEWQTLAAEVDGRILSTPVATGFVGAMIAMYASSNGQSSTNNADFDWFEYVGLDQ
ncbi:MAG TPA: glycoside hydrolase family 43 protein [Anaerolineales bacterium]|nr:glycoside hydrolase family 43 protein [Anaerolineales bacterium]